MYTDRLMYPSEIKDKLLKFISITLGIDSVKFVPFSPDIYPCLKMFIVIDINISYCSRNNMIKINPIFFNCFLSSLIILKPIGLGLDEKI